MGSLHVHNANAFDTRDVRTCQRHSQIYESQVSRVKDKVTTEITVLVAHQGSMKNQKAGDGSGPS